MTTRQRHLISLLRLSPWVLGASALSILALGGVRQIVEPSSLAPSNDVVGNYLQTFGTIYAVLLAFVVYVVWQQFNDARGHVEREATEIADLFRVVDGLPDAQRVPVQQQLESYVDAVLDREWDAMTKFDEAAIEGVGDILENVWYGIHAFEPTNECQKALHAEALTRYNDVTDIRTARLTDSRIRIPGGLKLLLYIGAVVLVGSMCLFDVERFWVHAAITGALAGGVSHVLYIVHDLDDAFSGDWQVPRDAFERTRRFMHRHAGRARVVCD
jgi:hypothetical protein